MIIGYISLLSNFFAVLVTQQHHEHDTSDGNRSSALPQIKWTLFKIEQQHLKYFGIDELSHLSLINFQNIILYQWPWQRLLETEDSRSRRDIPETRPRTLPSNKDTPTEELRGLQMLQQAEIETNVNANQVEPFLYSLSCTFALLKRAVIMNANMIIESPNSNMMINRIPKLLLGKTIK